MKQKDISKDNLFTQKGQKIVAAVYLVTAHLSDTDPIKQTLRSTVISLISADQYGGHTIDILSSRIETLFGAGVLAGLISEKNAAIILAEVQYFVRTLHIETSQESSVAHLFTPVLSVSQTRPQNSSQTRLDMSSVFQGQQSNRESISSAKDSTPTLSYTSQSHHSQAKSTIKKEESFSRSQRQETILSFINQKKSVTIKDIVLLFPDVSEKTVQRELISLVSAGAITKRGEKRWSVYMSVQGV